MAFGSHSFLSRASFDRNPNPPSHPASIRTSSHPLIPIMRSCHILPLIAQAKVETVPSPMAETSLLEEFDKDLPPGCRDVTACLEVLTPQLLQSDPNVQCNQNAWFIPRRFKFLTSCPLALFIPFVVEVLNNPEYANLSM